MSTTSKQSGKAPAESPNVNATTLLLPADHRTPNILGILDSPPVPPTGSPTGLSLLSDISSITRPSTSSAALSNADTARDLVVVTELLIDSDNEDGPSPNVPDDCSVGTAADGDFGPINQDAEEAQVERMQQLCVAGAPEGSEEDHCINKKDRIMELRDLEEDVKIAGFLTFEENFPQPPQHGEPSFLGIDNPANWSPFIFKAKFNKQKEFTGYELPAGTKYCPMDGDGIRQSNGWKFHYGSWEHNHVQHGTQPFRSGATTANMFPSSRSGCLDTKKLQQLGMTRNRMQQEDALFFLQLLYPICDPERSGIPDDPRMGFYYDLENFTRSYAAQNGIGGSYGHRLSDVLAQELVVFHGVLVRDGARGGSKGAIYRLWDPTSCSYDKEVASAMTFTRWTEIKRVIKYNDNAKSPKRGQPNFDPAYKFDLGYKVLVANCNTLTLHAELDQCIDEMTWKFMGYGESGLVKRIPGKY